MSAIEHAAARAGDIAAIRKPRITVAQLVLRGLRRWQRSRAINTLSRLDDRQLEDIGVSRNDIPRVAEGLVGPDGTRGARPKPRPQARPAADPAGAALQAAGGAG